VVTSNEEAGVSGWHEESRGDSIESMDMDMGLGIEVEVRAGQMVSTLFEVDVEVMVERSKTVSGFSLGNFWR
jgi:hypothetical protein